MTKPASLMRYDELQETLKKGMRISIAKDVLKHIGPNVQRGGLYISPPDLDKIPWNKIPWDSEENAQNHLSIFEKCQICALGACLVSHIRLFNKVKLNEIGGRKRLDIILTEYFDKSQLDLIETYFEGWDESAPQMWCLPVDPQERLRMIMENIIANDGTFKPALLRGMGCPHE